MPLDDYIPLILQRIAFALLCVVWSALALLGVMILLELINKRTK